MAAYVVGSGPTSLVVLDDDFGSSFFINSHILHYTVC